MPHFYVKKDDIVDGKFTISGDEAHHIVRVLRYKVEDELKLFDGSGKVFTGKIEEVTGNEIRGTIIGKMDERLPKININLYQSVPKGDRFDWLVEKAAELGVEKIIPVVTERSVIKKIPLPKIERWKRISLGACEQSNRSDIMEISGPLTFSDSIRRLPLDSLNIIPWESETTKTLDGILGTRSLPKEANIFIGPEGGFTQKEIETAVSSNVIPITLGPRILRVETAGILSVILVMNSAGEYSDSR